eukprot:1403822-Prymnesium_polylepis.2
MSWARKYLWGLRRKGHHEMLSSTHLDHLGFRPPTLHLVSRMQIAVCRMRGRGWRPVCGTAMGWAQTHFR